MVGRLQPVFTAGQARECAPNKNNSDLNKIHEMCFSISGVNIVATGLTLPSNHIMQMKIFLLCYCIKEDLVSLWLKMTLATRLTLARSTS